MTPPAISPTGGWIGTVTFVLIFVAALALFGVRTGRLITLLVKARPEDRTDHISNRIGEFFKVVLGQSGVLRDPLPGIAHFFTFWGFIIIMIGLLNLILGAFNGSLPIIGESRVFATLLNVFVILVLLAMLYFAYRRAVIHPRQLSSFLHGPWDGYISIGLILAVLVTLVLVETFEYAASFGAAWSPIGAVLGALLPQGTQADIIWYRIFWWLHILTVLGFLMYLPYSKHLHLLATPFNVFFRNYRRKRGLASPSRTWRSARTTASMR